MLLLSKQTAQMQWHNKGGRQLGARTLGRRLWEPNSTLFAVILNVFLRKNLDQSICLKIRIFWEKTVKLVSASGALPPNPCLPPATGSGDPRLPHGYSRLLLHLYRVRF